MDKDLKAKFLTALRSGTYQQGQGRLVSEDGSKFCCLGVYEHAVVGEPVERLQAKCGCLCLYDKDELNEHGLPLVRRGDLADMNDKGKTFAEIADYIEANL